MFKRPWRAFVDGLRDATGKRDTLAVALGRLEREVMDIVWRSDAVNVRDVRAAIPRDVAYTTVMTTLDRLYKKGLLQRQRDGRAFVYRAALTRQGMEEAIATGLLRGLLEVEGGRSRPLLSNLVDTIGDRDGALLDELEELVRQKRRQRDQG
jgi:predicted transcriptional regulator